MMHRFLRSALIALIGLSQLAKAQASSERFWIAFRLDTAHVSVFLDEADYDEEPAEQTRLKNSGSSYFPIATLSAAEVRKLAQRPNATPLKVGDTYDVILDSGHVAAVTLTSFITSYGGEAGMGLKRSIGGIVTIAAADRPFFTRKYYAATTHAATRQSAASHALLDRTALPLADSARIRDWLIDRFDRDVRRDTSIAAARFGFMTDKVVLAGGTRRFNVHAFWPDHRGVGGCEVTAWLEPRDSLVVHSLSKLSCTNDPPFTKIILGVVDLGNGRTGLVLDESMAGWYAGVSLVEYSDGPGPMKQFQSMGVSG